MPIDFTCPDCGKEMTARDELAGRRGKCSRCGQAFRVPGGTAEIPAYPSEADPLVVVPEVTALVDNPRRSGWSRFLDIAAMILSGIADVISNMAQAIAAFLIVGEWVITRLALYGMVLGGIGGSAASYGTDPFSQEMHRLTGNLSCMIGILGLAIVSRMPRKDLPFPEQFNRGPSSPPPKTP